MNDEEFLNGVWKKVHYLESKEKLLKLERKEKVENICIYLFLILNAIILIILSLKNIISFQTIVIEFGLIFIIAFKYEIYDMAKNY
ncbi:MAG: hypothetical protein ACI398_05295 [Clostridium sp.]